MTPLGGAAAATGALGVMEVVTTLVSPLPLLVIGGLVAPIVLAVAVLLLTPAWSRDPARNQRAMAMLDRVLAAIPGSRAVPEQNRGDTPPLPAPTATGVAPTRHRRWQRRRWQRS